MARDEDFFEPAEPYARPEGSWLLGQAIRALHGSEREYTEVLDVARRDAESFRRAAESWLTSESSDPMLRWSVLHVLADIRDPDAVEALHREAMRRVQVPVESGMCEQPAEIEELGVIMAVEGLGTLREDGSERAVEALFDVLAGHDRRSVLSAAVVALLSADETLRDRVIETLPEKERDLADLRTATVEDVQVTPPDQERPKGPVQPETRAKPRWGRGQTRPRVLNEGVS